MKIFMKVVLSIIILFFVLNTLIAYISYNKVLKGKKPVLYTNLKSNNGITTYDELLYKIKIEESYGKIDYSLKLFFVR